MAEAYVDGQGAYHPVTPPHAGVRGLPISAAGLGTSITTVFTADGTYTPIGGEVAYDITCIGPGGGGGSGRRGAGATVRSAGSGGGAGALSRHTFPASAVTGPVTVLVPAASGGGAAVTTDNTNGNPGAGTRDAVSTAFGALMKASCAGPGLGGSTGSAAGGGGGQFGMIPG
ncbi:MAG: hypothetical protein M3Q75_01075, partial [Gemmatimonadota bacterium]|nr:hypothetical protein [Gemmatimonadota bacterium]